MTPCPTVVDAVPVLSRLAAAYDPRHLSMYGVLLLAAYSLLLPGMAYYRALRTLYLVTDRRIVTVRQGKLLASLAFEAMHPPLLDLKTDGSGDIILLPMEKQVPADERSPQYWIGVRESRRVHDLIQTRIFQKRERIDENTDRYLTLLMQGRKPMGDLTAPDDGSLR